MRVEDSHLAELVDLIGCRAASLSASYLSLPLCIETATKSPGNPMVER